MPWENSRPNREPSEWLTVTTDALLAQSAVDRLTSGAHHLIIEGPSYRQRQRVSLDTDTRCPRCSMTRPGCRILLSTGWSDIAGKRHSDSSD